MVQLILTNQNKQPGCIAESQLSLNIINWFTDVPWDQEWREASEAGLAHETARDEESHHEPQHTHARCAWPHGLPEHYDQAGHEQQYRQELYGVLVVPQEHQLTPHADHADEKNPEVVLRAFADQEGIAPAMPQASSIRAEVTGQWVRMHDADPRQG